MLRRSDPPPPPWLRHVEGANYDRLQALEQLGVPAYPHVFDRHHAEMMTADQFVQRFSQQVVEKDEVHKTALVAFAGRLYGVRDHGAKVMFLDVGGDAESSQRLQIKLLATAWLDTATTAEQMRKALSVGDIVGFVGAPCRTRTGELSLEAHYGQLLAAHLRDIPVQLVDLETRYRYRSLDFTVNEKPREVFKVRAGIISALREFCEQKLGLLEVETPVLQMQAGGAAARPFHTHQNALNLDMVMRISPELYLKMLVAGGFTQGVYEIGKQFRNEDIDESHSPEFTSIELYWPYHDYNDLMPMTEQLFEFLARAA